MLAPSLPPPLLITTADDLCRLIEKLAPEPAVAVDTESNSLFAYHERVCLLQLSVAAGDYLIDPLQVNDLSPLATLFANPQQQKVFHAAEYDILCLKRDYHFEFANIFDTMVATRILGWPHLGLGTLLAEQFGVHLNKRYQRANWGERPLPPALLDYARLDTHYLLPLRDRLLSELHNCHRQEEAEAEFARLAHLQPPPENGSQWRTHFRRLLKGNHRLTPEQSAVLQALCYARDQQAQRLNRPPFKVISDTVLRDIAACCPRTPAALLEVKGMTPVQLRRHAAWILKAVEQGLTAPPEVTITPPPPTEAIVLERYQRLRRWRQQKALQRGVASEVILPRQALWEIAQRFPRTMEALATIEQLSAWHRHAYGTEILEVLKVRN